MKSAWQSDMTHEGGSFISPLTTAWSKNMRSVSLLCRVLTGNSSYGGTGSVCCFVASAGSVSEYLGTDSDSECGIVRYVSLVSILKRGEGDGSLAILSLTHGSGVRSISAGTHSSLHETGIHGGQLAGRRRSGAGWKMPMKPLGPISGRVCLPEVLNHRSSGRCMGLGTRSWYRCWI